MKHRLNSNDFNNSHTHRIKQNAPKTLNLNRSSIEQPRQYVPTRPPTGEVSARARPEKAVTVVDTFPAGAGAAPTFCYWIRDWPPVIAAW